MSLESSTGDLVEAIARALVERGQTLAVAESCTGGLIMKRLTDRSGASRFFLGGVIAYDDQVKQDLLGVSEVLLEKEGAVSSGVAEQMARGVAGRLEADAGVGITGVAGPGGGTEDKPVGTVWYAASLEGWVWSELQTFAGDRDAIRERAAQAALALLYRMVTDGPGIASKGERTTSDDPHTTTQVQPTVAENQRAEWETEE